MHFRRVCGPTRTGRRIRSLLPARYAGRVVADHRVISGPVADRYRRVVTGVRVG